MKGARLSRASFRRAELWTHENVDRHDEVEAQSGNPVDAGVPPGFGVVGFACGAPVGKLHLSVVVVFNTVILRTVSTRV